MQQDKTGCRRCGYLQYPDDKKYKETNNKNFLKFWCCYYDKMPKQIRNCAWQRNNLKKRIITERWKKGKGK